MELMKHSKSNDLSIRYRSFNIPLSLLSENYRKYMNIFVYYSFFEIRYSRWRQNAIESEEIVYAYFSQRSSTSSYTNYNDVSWLNGQVFGMDIVHYLDINEVKREM
eukprot:UN02837